MEESNREQERARWELYGKWMKQCRLQYYLSPKPLPPVRERVAHIQRIIEKYERKRK